MKVVQYLFVVFLICASSSTKASDNILILSPSGEQFSEIVEGLKGDLEEEVSFVVMDITKSTSSKDLLKKIDSNKPRAVVLIGNASVNLYLESQKSNPSLKSLPSVAVGALFLDKFIKEARNIIGIKYEIPFVSSAVSVRDILSKDFKRVGVIYRELMKDFVDENKRFAEAEGIELVGLELPNSDPNRIKNLKFGLDTLLSDDIDALWIVNDNNLLNGKTLSGVWIPVLKTKSIPVIVGLESLLSEKLGLGTFAVIPDHYGLGVQTSSLLIELMENGWEISDSQLEQPLSVKKFVSKTLLEKKNIGFDKKKLVNFDSQL